MRAVCTFICLLFLLVCTQTKLAAQEEKTYKAIIIDSLQKTPVEKCTVSLIGKKGDESKKASDSKGHFSFTIKQDSVTLLLQHIGYTEKRVLLLLSKIQQGTDTIYLMPADKRMDDIVVKAKVPPVVQRGDTTEFNIDSAMFEPFDVVEDLVKRLPGLEIDAEGKMTFHGKPITRILVDGEDLFGGDPNFSMKKLPAGLVAKIQVMDTKTLEQLFNGTPSDGEDKTLNIKLKPGNKTFGSGDVLVGTKNQLEGNGNISQFDGPKRLSLMGSISSSNKIGLNKIRTGPTSSATTASANYSNSLGKLRINSSYGYNENGNTNKIYRERTQVITADTSIFTKNNNLSDYNGNGHRVSLGINWFIDSSSTLDMSLAANYGNSNSKNSSTSITAENGALRNESFNNSSSTGNNQALTGSISWLKRLNRKGRRISLSARTNLGSQESLQLSQSTNTYFKLGLPVDGDTLDRRTRNVNQSRGYSLNMSYSETISKQLRFDLRTELDFNNSNTARDIYNLDSVTKTAVYDSTYSAKISSSTSTQNLTASVNYSTEKWNVSSGLSTVLQHTARSLQNDDIQQNLLRYSPSLNATYSLSKGKAVRASFSANTIQPSIDQLQPVPDNSNPLFIRIGNPNLRTAFAQNYTVGYTANEFSAEKQNSFSGNLVYAPTSNQIVNAVYYDEYRRQTSQFINVDGIYSVRSNLSINRNKQKDKINKGWSASSGGSYGQQVYFQANKQYYSRSYSTNINLAYSKRELVVRAARYTISLGSSFNRNWTPADTKILNTTRLNIAPQLEIGCNLFDFIYANASYRVWYNKLDYHSTLRRNDEYSMHHVNSEIRFQIQKKYWVNTTVFYQYNTRVPEGTPKNMINCNLSATGQVLKGRGQFVLTAVDLFAQSTNLRRTVGENYIEDLQIDNLQNYFTLRFQYNFSKLERKETGRTRINSVINKN
ncbi:MAG: hypothetical protein EOO10_01430 [Chitinophagaceae bacterium]|nr:MAG: hypothetical protein EOO10_01430 [Chitinophagaceae bacterium]